MLMWLMNIDFAGGDGVVEEQPITGGMLAAQHVRRVMHRRQLLDA